MIPPNVSGSSAAKLPHSHPLPTLQPTQEVNLMELLPKLEGSKIKITSPYAGIIVCMVFERENTEMDYFCVLVW